MLLLELPEAKVDINFLVSSLPHFSHFTGPTWEENTKVSNFSPHSLQRNSKIGIKNSLFLLFGS